MWRPPKAIWKGSIFHEQVFEQRIAKLTMAMKKCEGHEYRHFHEAMMETEKFRQAECLYGADQVEPLRRIPPVEVEQIA